jgi:hypothetical protein
LIGYEHKAFDIIQVENYNVGVEMKQPASISAPAFFIRECNARNQIMVPLQKGGLSRQKPLSG